jgi:ribosome modulation factor
MRTFVQALGATAALAVIAGATTAYGQAGAGPRNIETSFLWTQSEAEQKCPQVASEAGGRWTGDWRIAVPGRTSYCVVTDIAPERAARPARVRDVDAGPIWNQAGADDKCPRVAAAAQGRWTGQWRTVSPGGSSVCEVAETPRPDPRPDGARFIEAGPIWNQADAEEKCPVVAAAVRGRWAGQWVTTVQGEMSTCGIVDMPPPRPRPVDAGPIWSQADAEKKCPVAAFAVHGRWTGQWSTTRQGRMSVCEVVD